MCGCIGGLLIIGSFFYLGNVLLGNEPMEPGLTLFALLFVTVGVAGIWKFTIH